MGIIAHHIETKGIIDNKKVKPQQQNAFYQTLVKEKKDRNRLMFSLQGNPDPKQKVPSEAKKPVISAAKGMFDISIDESARKTESMQVV